MQVKPAALVATGSILAGSFLFGVYPESSISLSAEDIAMFEKTQTWCLGRYLVDIPRDAVLKYHDNNYKLGKINSGFGYPKFRALIEETLEKRKKVKDIYGYIRSEYPEDSDRQIIVSRMEAWGHVSYAVDAFTLNPKHKSGAGRFFYISEDAYAQNMLDEVLADYREILSTVRYRFEADLPKEPGFCFKDGFVANDGKTSQAEDADLHFDLKDYPDVSIILESGVLFVEEKPLLERTSKEAQSLLVEGKINIIREKNREINGMKGQESLVSFQAVDGTGEAHIFKWETLGELDNPLKPDITLEITTGDMNGGTASSLTRPQVLALYEAIVKTIRLRPVEDPKPEPQAQAPDPEDFPHRIATGDKCPKRGHWRCVEDGHRHNFVVGQLMPNATFSQPATGFFNRLMGKRVYRDGPGHWEWAEETPPAETRE